MVTDTGTLEKFWAAYDRYTKNADKEAKAELVRLLPMLEAERLMRPEKGWGMPDGYEVLKVAEIFFPRAEHPFSVYEGEILLEDRHFDRETLVNRFPIRDFVRSYGCLYHKDPGCRVFLPLYEPDLIKFKIGTFNAKVKTWNDEYFKTGQYKYIFEKIGVIQA